jgi:SEC-C motif-containing protein
MCSTPLKQPISSDPCSCGSSMTFSNCCEPIILSISFATTPDQLMRARFTAYVCKALDFLKSTDLPTAKLRYDDDWSKTTPWTKLIIHGVSHRTADEAQIDFTAYHVGQNGELAHHELCELRRINNRWLYYKCIRNGPKPLRKAAEVPRNSQCPCGSGIKFKHCCGA